MMQRRAFLLGVGATAPAIILTPGLLMPVRTIAPAPSPRKSVYLRHTYIWDDHQWRDAFDGVTAIQRGHVIGDIHPRHLAMVHYDYRTDKGNFRFVAEVHRDGGSYCSRQKHADLMQQRNNC